MRITPSDRQWIHDLAERYYGAGSAERKREERMAKKAEEKTAKQAAKAADKAARAEKRAAREGKERAVIVVYGEAALKAREIAKAQNISLTEMAESLIRTAVV